MEFLAPYDSIGFQIQTDEGLPSPGLPFIASVDVFNTTGGLLYSNTFNGTSSLGTFDGSALFIGLKDNNGPNIGAVVISTNSGNPLFANDFAIDDPSFTATAPEPASMTLLGSATVLLAFALRKRLKKSDCAVEAQQ